MQTCTFDALNLSPWIMDAIRDLGFEEASPIQAQAIPLIMAGKDLIGQAQTGTGKTAAFVIPILEALDPANKAVQAVILCPTRELCIQVADECRKLMKYRDGLEVVPVYGGQEIERQLRVLKKGAQIVVGTPGRTMDHMRRGTLNLEAVKLVVLDEADEMLDMGFLEDMVTILSETPEARQTVMFSATMPGQIVNLTKKFQREAVTVNVANKKTTDPQIHQTYLEVSEKNKPEVLARLLDVNNIKLALVFCNTRHQVDTLVELLKMRGYFADALHGDMSQTQRDRVMNGFRTGTVEILVATDVAGRGIDVNNVEAVFNYDLPRDDDDYLHRIGRTARAGKTGLSFSFISGRQVYNLKRIEHAHNFVIHRQNVPTMDEIELSKFSAYTQRIQKTIADGHLSKYVTHIEQMLGDDLTTLDVAAALLKLILEKESESLNKHVDFSEPITDKPKGPAGNRSGKPYNRAKAASRSNNPYDRLISKSLEKTYNKENNIVKPKKRGISHEAPMPERKPFKKRGAAPEKPRDNYQQGSFAQKFGFKPGSTFTNVPKKPRASED